ncbi:hypothetical protein [Flavobacterium sp. MDT1-60]|uniref:hypothetical protein n=1 Tax=Flavobacterium sp. MDT1-60 TaxID=1979344 RepID=UPI0017805520|nr:hypothetical protein [Flavobacterium sp. MDT1-60]QOG02565.1 hypothetical protein IHE43_22810 [Flavobacterium sp. MDT1-60]
MKKYKFIVLVFVCLFFMIGYSFAQTKLIPTNNKGGYTVTIGKGQLNNKQETVEVLIRDGKSVTIRGHVFDVKTGKPLSNVQLTDGCFKFFTTDEGEYSFRTRNLEGNSFYMRAVVYPFLAVETDYIDIYNKKEVIVDFYLMMDERPLFDCSGIGSDRHKRIQDELNDLK